MKLILFALVIFAISATQSVPLSEYAKESVQQQCMKKYGPELANVKKNLLAELKECKTASNEKECTDAATTKATDAIAEISEKIRECVAAGSQFNFIGN